MIRQNEILAWVLPGALLLPLVAACSGGAGEERPAAGSEAAQALPDPSEAGLVTPEEAAQAAQESIDAANAESELEQLRREIEQG